MPRIGVLSNSAGPDDPDRAFRQSLTDLGYIDGKNILVDARYSNGRSELFPEFVADFLRVGVDIIVGWGPPAIAAARRATRGIPIIFIAVADPVGAGFVETLARPGGNVTGIGPFDELGAKRLEILKEAIPSVRRVAVLINPTHRQADAMVKVMTAAAGSLGIEIDVLGAASAAATPWAFSEMKKRQVNALAGQPDAMFWVRRHEIVSLAARAGLPLAEKTQGARICPRDVMDLLGKPVDAKTIERAALGGTWGGGRPRHARSDGLGAPLRGVAALLRGLKGPGHPAVPRGAQGTRPCRGRLRKRCFCPTSTVQVR
jgi:putative ABC transport system substrate-binding protein